MRSGFLAYSAVLILLTLALLEFYLLPLQLGMPRELALLGFAAPPGQAIDGQRINNAGFSGEQPTLTAQPKELRLLILGASNMFNRHLGDTVQQALAASQSSLKVKVTNAALRSHTSRADLLKWRHLSRYHWDYVLIYNGINDLWANHVAAEKFAEDYRHLSPWYRRNSWLDHSLIARLVYNRVYQWRDCGVDPVFPQKETMNAANDTAMVTYRDNLQQLLTEIRAAGAVPLLATQAYHLPENYSRRAFLDGELDYVNPDNYDRRDVFNRGEPAYVRAGLQQQNQLVRQLAAELGVSLFDVDKQMTGQAQWFGDVCHFNADGVRYFSEQLALNWPAFAATVESRAARAPSQVAHRIPSATVETAD